MDAAQLRDTYAQYIAEAKALAEPYLDVEVLPEDVAKEIDTKLQQAEKVGANIDRAVKMEAAQKFLDEPMPTKAAHMAWNREAMPAEGTIPGVAAEGTSLLATNAVGEMKIRRLGSGEYKDAINSYIRTGGERFGRLNEKQVKVLQEGQDTAGGFFVPVEQRAEVVKKMATVTGLRQYVRKYPVGSDVISFPKVVYTTDDLYTAGTRFTWTAEAPSADISEATNPVAGQINIPVHTATCAVILTRAMIEDSSFDILGYISDLVGETFALGEDDTIWDGTGVGQPQGIATHANATVAHASGGMQVLSGASGALAWGTGGTTGIFAQEAYLPPQYEGNARWFATKATYSAIRALNATTAGFQWMASDSYPNLANGYAPSLLGYPIVKDQFVDEIATTAHPLAFGDMEGYYLVERVGISIEVLREIRALRDEVVVYARRRVGGALIHDWKLKLLKSHNS